MGTSVSIRVDLGTAKNRPEVTVMAEDAGPVVYLTVRLSGSGDRVSICVRDLEQAKALVAAAEEAASAFPS